MTSQDSKDNLGLPPEQPAILIGLLAEPFVACPFVFAPFAPFGSICCTAFLMAVAIVKILPGVSKRSRQGGNRKN
jgi:hypothetical protein